MDELKLVQILCCVTIVNAVIQLVGKIIIGVELLRDIMHEHQGKVIIIKGIIIFVAGMGFAYFFHNIKKYPDVIHYGGTYLIIAATVFAYGCFRQENE